jgi:hypothetical protein
LSNDWDAFIRNYERNVSSYKPKVKVTIYGSYNPPREKALLKDLKMILIKDGYTNTQLVEDRQKDSDKPLKVSEQSILYSDINLLVFTKTGKRLGVVRELAFLARPSMSDKTPFSTVFDQVKDGESSIPSLSQEDVTNALIPRRAFNSFKELRSIITIQTYWILERWIKKQQQQI